MCTTKKLGERARRLEAIIGTRKSVWEVILLDMFFNLHLVWVPGFGMAPQATFDLFFSCFSKYEAMEQCT